MIGTKIGNRYEVQARIGQGGMGTVYRGQDRETGQAIAVKVLDPPSNRQLSDLIEGFLREGRLLRELDHPNILSHLDTVRYDDRYCLILEFLPDGDLRQLLNSGELSLEQTLTIALDLADALTRAHRLGIIHRDLKPANVLLAADGTPRLADFGIAHFRTQTTSAYEGELVGTIAYLSPETIRGEAPDELADIWAFGVLLFECLTGQQPFSGSTPISLMQAIQNQEMPDLQDLKPGLSDDLADLVYRMLARRRVARIPSVRLIGDELETILKARGVDLAQAIAGRDAAQAAEMRSNLFSAVTPVTSPPRHNLPAGLNPFIGRQRELAELDELLEQADTRLVTVLGPGGMGKTRFAIQAAGKQVERFADGVFFVRLARIERIEDLATAIAESVQLQLSSGVSPDAQLKDFFRAKSSLLLMDNFEHLREGAGLITQLLKEAPGLQVLATSRQRLRLSGEQVFNLSGLGSSNGSSEGMQLFLETAARLQPSFELQDAEQPLVRAICEQVGGMPLAIEMAAAWTKVLALDEILDELQGSFELLESDQQDIPNRHRSVQAVFDVSWQRLSAEDQAVFAKLSVFRGGFTRAAAQAVSGASLRQLMGLLDRCQERNEKSTFSRVKKASD